MQKIIQYETLGCKLNQVESEGAASAFKNADFEISMSPFSASTPENPSVILCVVNTCTVTAKAEQKARRIIRLLLAKCPVAAVLVTGCYAQNSREEILSIGTRVCVLGGQYKGHLADIPSLLNENTQTEESAKENQDKDKNSKENKADSKEEAKTETPADTQSKETAENKDSVKDGESKEESKTEQSADNDSSKT